MTMNTSNDTKNPTDAQEPISIWLILTGIGLIFGLAFILNYINLSESFATIGGLTPVAWGHVQWVQGSITPYFFPMLVDAFLVLATVILLRNQMVSEGTKLAVSVIGLTSLVAVVFNLHHLKAFELYHQAKWLDLFFASLVALFVPAVILSASEMGKGYLKSVALRKGAYKSLAEINNTLSNKQAQQEQVKSATLTATRRLEALRGDVVQLEADKVAGLADVELVKAEYAKAKKGQFVVDDITASGLRVDGMRLAGHSLKVAGDLLEVSEATARNHHNRLNGQRMFKGGE